MANIDENTIADVRSLYYNSTELIKRIKTNPSLSDSIIELVVEVLKYDCLLGTEKENERAKRILIKAKARRYIPNISKEKRSQEEMINYFQLDFGVLVLLVELYGKVISKFVGIGHHEQHDKEELVTQAFRALFHKDPPKNVLNHSDTITNIALAFISHRFLIRTQTLISFFRDRRSLKPTQLGGQLISWVNKDGEPVTFTNNKGRILEFWSSPDQALDTWLKLKQPLQKKIDLSQKCAFRFKT